MDNMVRSYCKALDIPTFSLFNSAFDAGIPTSEVMEDTLVCFSRSGRIYTGFRHYPGFDLDLSGVTSILLVRDPRDMLVSLYYSVAKSHVVPRGATGFLNRRRKAASMTVDDFALNQLQLYKKNFSVYRQKLKPASLTMYRYEDVIYKKREWLEDMISTMGLPVDIKLISHIADEFDIFPENENPGQHIRQVHPGNYRNKLQTSTIDTLNEELGEFLSHYGYT